MTKKALPPAETLHQLLSYNPETGELFWKHRPIEMFEGDGVYPAERRWKSWNTRHAGTRALSYEDDRGYLVGAVFHQNHKAHRVIWAMMTGEWPNHIDHLNGNPKDNRWVNLKDGDRSANMSNRKLSSNNKSGAHGVSFAQSHQRWIARIQHNGKRIGLGSYRNREDAVAARKAAEKTYGYLPTHGRQG